MKIFTKLTALAVVLAIMTGCVGTRQVSHNISDEGTVAQDDIVFPELDKAWEKNGLFPNSENLSKLKSGLAKDEIYTLIGRPHFSERQKAREWDYIMKFRQADDSIRVCQYKIIFDKEYKAREFYWLPSDCVHELQVKPSTPSVVVAPPVVISQRPIISEKVNLGADTLFGFDKYHLQDMLPAGRMALDELAAKLRDYQIKGMTQVIITGHTDYLGDDFYNLNLSQLRAQTVRSYLINQGVSSDTLVATGAGESQPIQQCHDTSRSALISCLQPNRRVEVAVSVYEFGQTSSNQH